MIRPSCPRTCINDVPLVPSCHSPSCPSEVCLSSCSVEALLSLNGRRNSIVKSLGCVQRDGRSQPAGDSASYHCSIYNRELEMEANHSNITAVTPAKLLSGSIFWWARQCPISSFVWRTRRAVSTPDDALAFANFVRLLALSRLDRCVLTFYCSLQG